MTPLPHDSLVFKLATAGPIPCTEGAVQFEVGGDAATFVDAEFLRHAAAAVLDYFRNELNRSSVTPQEFTSALETILHSFGLTQISAEKSEAQIADSDLSKLAEDGMELLFFQRLREELRRQLQPAPRVVRFHGLRDCVKKLTGAKRWSDRCQKLNDQIVEFLRNSLSAETPARPCGLVVV